MPNTRPVSIELEKSKTPYESRNAWALDAQRNTQYRSFLVSGRDLACQQEVSLALTKTPPIHYYNVVDSAFNFYAR